MQRRRAGFSLQGDAGEGSSANQSARQEYARDERDATDEQPRSICLEVTNATRRYGDFVALDGVDVTVRAGEIVGILGPNGAGKSTLIRACEGLEPIDQGRVSLLGRDIAVERDAVKGRIGLVLQRPKFSGYATVRETIALFRSFRPGSAATVPDRLTELLGLVPKVDVRISKLSGGERQRLAVLIGLMGGHELILLDEPTSELDPQARRVVWQLISATAREQNCAVLMTTHQMEEAEVLCDRVYIIDHGRIITSGSPAQIIVENCEDMAVTVTLHVDALDTIRSLYEGLDIARHGRLVKCQKSVASVQEGQKLMRELLDRLGSAVIDVGLQRSNLEDVFIKLTGAHLRG